LTTVLNVPNFLTLLRIFAIPVFLILLGDRRYAEALGVFVAAGVTDALDGAIARMMHTKTTLGAYLDPAADKLLLLSAFISLAFMNEVPRWLTVVVITRDVVVVLGYFLLFTITQETMEVRPTVSGKLSTFFQLGSVAVVLVGLVWPHVVPHMLDQAFFYVAGALTTLAGLQYVHRGLVWVQVRGDA
jgi:cardiolipin synthase